jgi:hypothetical protein
MEYKNIIIVGDANGHTGSLPDYVIFDEFLINHFDLENMNVLNEFQSLTYINFEINRSSKCNKVDRLGLKLLDICKNNDPFIRSVIFPLLTTQCRHFRWCNILPTLK